MNNQFEEPDQPMQSIDEIMQIIAEATIPAAGTHSLNHYLAGSLDIDDDMEEDLETDPDLDIDSSGEIVYAMWLLQNLWAGRNYDGPYVEWSFICLMGMQLLSCEELRNFDCWLEICTPLVSLESTSGAHVFILPVPLTFLVKWCCFLYFICVVPLSGGFICTVVYTLYNNVCNKVISVVFNCTSVVSSFRFYSPKHRFSVVLHYIAYCKYTLSSLRWNS